MFSWFQVKCANIMKYISTILLNKKNFCKSWWILNWDLLCVCTYNLYCGQTAWSNQMIHLYLLLVLVQSLTTLKRGKAPQPSCNFKLPTFRNTDTQSGVILLLHTEIHWVHFIIIQYVYTIFITTMHHLLHTHMYVCICI
jgi:hypothetical protein